MKEWFQKFPSFLFAIARYMDAHSFAKELIDGLDQRRDPAG